MRAWYLGSEKRTYQITIRVNPRSGIFTSSRGKAEESRNRLKGAKSLASDQISPFRDLPESS
jgi:hypothetical protein